jgi:hypothetical protein
MLALNLIAHIAGDEMRYKEKVKEHRRSSALEIQSMTMQFGNKAKRGLAFFSRTHL